MEHNFNENKKRFEPIETICQFCFCQLALLLSAELLKKNIVSNDLKIPKAINVLMLAINEIKQR